MSDLPAIPLVLDRKDPGGAHVVVGDLQTHVDFLREALGGAEVTEMDKIDDLTTLARLGMPGKFIWVVPSEKALGIAQDVRVKLSIWAAKPIKKRTAAIRSLTRQAMAILGIVEMEKEALDALGDAVISQMGEDAPPQALIWAATWLLTDTEAVAEGKNWKHPWEDPWGWNRKAPMAARLHVLYRDLAGWVFARDDNRAGAERLGIIPSRLQWLKTIHLDDQKVNRALVALSAWKSHPDDGFTTALIIGTIFDR